MSCLSVIITFQGLTNTRELYSHAMSLNVTHQDSSWYSTFSQISKHDLSSQLKQLIDIFDICNSSSVETMTAKAVHRYSFHWLLDLLMSNSLHEYVHAWCRSENFMFDHSCNRFKLAVTFWRIRSLFVIFSLSHWEASESFPRKCAAI